MGKTFHDGKVTLHAGDCLDVLKTMPENSIDAVVTDPPYHLTSIVKRFGGANAAPAKGNEAFIRASRGFMGKVWDGGDIAFTVALWAEVLRVLKPGGHMVAFSGTRTYHRMAVAIEDARFEIRDQLAWVYGSGFPKSHDVSKGIDRTAGVEREVLGKRSDGRYAYGFSDETKWHDQDGFGNGIKGVVTAPATDAARQWQGWGTALKPAWEPICLARKPLSESTIAANVMRWGTGAINIDGCRIEGPIDSGWAKSGSKASENIAMSGPNYDRDPKPDNGLGRWPANLCHDGCPEVMAGFPCGESRYFYTSKADYDDRLNSRHPTVKPVDLMQWLVRLVCPKGAIVLDPFAGTGTTGAASFIEGRQCVLIEREAEYLADIEKRMGMLLSGSEERSWKLAKPEPLEALPLFSLTGPAA